MPFNLSLPFLGIVRPGDRDREIERGEIERRGEREPSRGGELEGGVRERVRDRPRDGDLDGIGGSATIVAPAVEVQKPTINGS